MKGSFADDPGLAGHLFDLLDMVFPGLRRTAEHARTLGAPWESASTPFIATAGGPIVSHVGVIELPLVVLGQPLRVASVHGVATHPAARRHGLYRLVMEEALEYCAGRYETQILTTEHPEYFEPFGFRVVREHLFKARVGSPGGADGLRLLDTRDPADVALLHRLLEHRSPVSELLGVGVEKAVFCFNEGRRPLRYAADLDALVCMELEGARLTLFDVVGERIPPLAVLLERIPQPVDEVAICFSPDRLEVATEATQYLLHHDGPSHLMARGPFTAEGRPFMLPRSART